MTKHDHKPSYGRLVLGCPRCTELANGAQPVKGWGAQRKEQEARQMADIRAHRCEAAGCGPVCTFGDW